MIELAVLILGLVFAFSFVRAYKRSLNSSAEDGFKIAVREAKRRGLDLDKIQEITSKELTPKQ